MSPEDRKLMAEALQTPDTLSNAEALAELERTPLLKPSYYDFGLGYQHNMPCCVYTSTEVAVLDASIGVFTPSWKARKEGWHLVKAETKLQKWLLKKFFSTRGFN
jgi:hypothetical protein